MIVKDRAGDKIEIEIEGTNHDDIEISQAKYLSDSDREVTDETIDWILKNDWEDIYTTIIERMIDMEEYARDAFYDR